MRSNKVLLLGAIFALVVITAIFSFIGIQTNNNAYHTQYLQSTNNTSSSDSLNHTPNPEEQPLALIRFANNRYLAQAVRSIGSNNRSIPNKTYLISKIVEAILQQIELLSSEKHYYFQETFLSYQEIFCRIIPPRAGPLA